MPEKGLHLAILAAQISGLPLHIAGPVSDAEYYSQQIHPRLSENIIYLGHLDHAELIGSIAGAVGFLCTPMWEEPYGLVLAESLACGTPVAAFSRGALPALLDEKSGILVPADDYNALAEAATKLQYLSRADCRKRAEKIGDGNRMIDAYEALYTTLIDQHRAQQQVTTSASLCLEDITTSSRLRSIYDAAVMVPN